MSRTTAKMIGLMSGVAFAAPDKGGGGGIDKKDKAFLKLVRETFETETGHDCRVTDEGILQLASRVEGGLEGFMEMDGDAQIELLKKAEDAFKGIAVSDPGINGLVAKLDQAFYAELDLCVEAVIKNKQASVDVYGQLKRVWSKEMFDACPYPGSDKDDVAGTNYAPDIVEKKAVDGSKIRVVWLNDFVQAMPKGKAAQQDMDDASNELKTAGSVTRFKGKGKQWLKDTFNTAKQERDAIRKAVRVAIQLHHKLSAIEGMPLVKWQWIPGSHDKCAVVPKNYQGKETVKVTRSPKPLWLSALDTDGNEVPNSGRDFSVSQIVAFNPTKALAMPDGGTLGDLIDSAKAEPETPEQVGEKMSTEVFDTTLVVFNAKLSNTAERASLRQRMLEPNNEDLRESVCALYLNLKGAYDANAKWYEERINGKPEAKTKAA